MFKILKTDLIKFQKNSIKSFFKESAIITIASTLVILPITTTYITKSEAKTLNSVSSLKSSNKYNVFKSSIKAGSNNISLNQSYSGLIIRVKNKKQFQNNMSPKIFSENGNSIYLNTKNFSHEDFNYLIREGIAIFTNDIDKAKKRSGNKPLIIDALDTKNTDTVIISNENAQQVLIADYRAPFLKKCKVSFMFE